METRKLTEGALLSALQVVLGLILLSTGLGYSLYLELLLPITMTAVYLRCGAKYGLLAGLNTILLIAFCFGDIIGAVYMGQALAFGFLCGYLIERKGNLHDDLMLASLIGCIFLLILDALTARIVGFSLLDTDGLDEIFVLIPGETEQMFEVIFYISIAAIPIATVLMTYVGGLLLGHRMGLLRGEALEKYRVIRYFKIIFPHSYHSKRVLYQAIIGSILCLGLWPVVNGGYSKALVATSGIVLLYFVLNDYTKLIAQYLVNQGKQPALVSLLHFLVLVSLVNAFYVTACLLVLIGCCVDMRTSTREREQQVLAFYLREHLRLKNQTQMTLRKI